MDSVNSLCHFFLVILRNNRCGNGITDAGPLYQKITGKIWKAHSHCQLCLIGLFFIWKDLHLAWTFL